MRYTVATITVSEARAALSLDAGKTADAIRAIVARRGMEAEAAIDAAMTRTDFGDDGDRASCEASARQRDPETFDVVGLKYDGAVLAGGFDWEMN
jgi:hypothetical protein